MRGFRGGFTALQHRDFRLLWFGQLVSTAGSMMHTSAVWWHITTLVPEGRRGAALGVVGLVKFLPTVVFSLLSGVVADSLDRRKLMLWTQTAMALIAGTLAWITFRGQTQVWHLYALTALLSAVNSFDGPARQSLIPKLVPPHHFPGAISLNSMLFEIASVAGPLLAGTVIASLGLGWVYWINALSFVAVIMALLAMRPLPPREPHEHVAITLASALEGLRYVFQSPLIRWSMLLDFGATFCAAALSLLPVFAVEVLHVGARGYGWLGAAMPIGAVMGSLWMAQRADRIVRRGVVLLCAVAAYGAATIGYGASTTFAFTFGFLVLAGISDAVSAVLRNVIRQLSTPDRLRGRMTSVNMVFFLGGPQLGEAKTGFLAQAIGPMASVVCGGIGCLFWTAWTARKSPELRNYRRDDPPRV
jgi:MFS family permease